MGAVAKHEVYAKRDGLFKEKWWQDYWHLKKIMDFLMSSKIENLIAIRRQMEKVHRGFKTGKGKFFDRKI